MSWLKDNSWPSFKMKLKTLQELLNKLRWLVKWRSPLPYFGFYLFWLEVLRFNGLLSIRQSRNSQPISQLKIYKLQLKKVFLKNHSIFRLYFLFPLSQANTISKKTLIKASKSIRSPKSQLFCCQKWKQNI